MRNPRAAPPKHTEGLKGEGKGRMDKRVPKTATFGRKSGGGHTQTVQIKLRSPPLEKAASPEPPGL